MPTGYTAGILDGKITTFPQFAKICMRAMGATIHMRDNSLNDEYEERTPSRYHSEAIEKANQSLKDAESMTDEEIINSKKIKLQESKKYHLESIKKSKEGEKSMKAILKEVEKWNPPTKDHVGLKDFMIEQIVKTIDFDCKTDYHDKGLLEIEKEFENLNANKIRLEMIAQAKKDLKYHKNELALEIDRCNSSNKWVQQLLESLKS